jgi:dienelactone hydrolase
MNRIGLCCRSIVPVLILAAASMAAEPAKRTVVWDTKALFLAPKVHATTDSPAPGMRALFYEGADYKGQPTRVFAYYAAPKGTPPEGGWPAVVCAHGGGGTAYPDWVRKWNGKGYAAIAMDLEGHLPGGKSHGVKGNLPTGRGHDGAGPARIDWFGDRDLPDTQQWFYHAVADVIRANSLLRSFKEINPNKIGLTGISWGGTIVSSVAGVDSRFAFVIPVYGAGFIHKSDNAGLAQWFPPKNMTAAQYRDYRTKWDPAAHLPHAKMPMLFVTSVADPVFQIDIFAKSAQAAGGPSTLCIRPWMIHAHGSGWDDAGEIYAFADSVVRGSTALPSLKKPTIDPDTGKVRVTRTGELSEIWLYYTSSKSAWKGRKWHFIRLTADKDAATTDKPLPNSATAYLVYGFRGHPGGYRDNHVATKLVVVKP